MSWEKATLEMTLSPSARAAAMRARWAWDLDGGGVTVPANLAGVMVISMEFSSSWQVRFVGEGLAPPAWSVFGHFPYEGFPGSA